MLPTRFSLAESLVHNGTAGGMAPPVEWRRRPVLGSLLGCNVLVTQFTHEFALPKIIEIKYISFILLEVLWGQPQQLARPAQPAGGGGHRGEQLVAVLVQRDEDACVNQPAGSMPYPYRGAETLQRYRMTPGGGNPK